MRYSLYEVEKILLPCVKATILLPLIVLRVVNRRQRIKTKSLPARLECAGSISDMTTSTLKSIERKRVSRKKGK